ncbi:MAG: hypothetical protein QGF59_27000, partial [Pirellulaceae bacterium]|nr:hypothetical protein [Pirellulaceae bacterium]
MKLRNMAINRLRSGQRKHNAVGRFKRTMSVERLEDRSLLACDAFQFGESVLILGDRNDNVIETVDNGDRSLDVVCSSNQLLRDGHFAFDNVGRIFVLPRAGNDTLMHTLSPQAQSTVSNPIDVFARLGTGDDILRVLVENARLAGPFEVLGGGGAGNDALSMEVRNSTVDDVMTTEFNGWRGQDNLEAIYSGVRFEAPHSIKLNGAQDDDYQRLIYERVAFGPDATFETDVQGGNGNNTLLSLFDDVDVDGQAQGWQWAGAGDRPHVSGMDSSNTIVALHNNFHSASPIVAHYEGGKGDDLFLSAFTNSNVAADHDMVINARRGNDLAMLFESNVTRGGGPQAAGIENHVELNMGKGNDDVTILQGCPTSLADAFELFPGDSVVAGSVARIQQTLDRLGLDLFSGSSPSQLCPSSSVPDQGQLKVNVLTGDGEDNVVVGVTNIFWGRSINRLSADLGRRDDTLSIVDRGGLYKNIDVKGRKGKDDIRLDYQIDPRNESDIIARVDGGRDDDTLAWTVVGDDSAFELSAELNGGAGIDH